MECQNLFCCVDGRQVADMFITTFEQWCNDRKPEKITRIWFGENFSGYLTNIQMYSRLLTNEEMKDITTCKLFFYLETISTGKQQTGQLITLEKTEPPISGRLRKKMLIIFKSVSRQKIGKCCLLMKHLICPFNTQDVNQPQLNGTTTRSGVHP